MRTYRSFLWLNSLSLLVVIALIIYSKLFGPSVSALFLQPPYHREFNVALLTHTFQILCAVPPVICGFSFALLKKIQPHRKKNTFILGSALLTGGFLLNEIYRIHIILAIAGIPKLVTITVYAVCLLLYAFRFKKHIQTTPYILLLTGVSLLFIGITVDSLHLGKETFAILLEGMPKLFSEINIVLYFWYVCYEEVMPFFKLSPTS
jgi:hypothetical protein